MLDVSFVQLPSLLCFFNIKLSADTFSSHHGPGVGLLQLAIVRGLKFGGPNNFSGTLKEVVPPLVIYNDDLPPSSKDLSRRVPLLRLNP